MVSAAPAATAAKAKLFTSARTKQWISEQWASSAKTGYDTLAKIVGEFAVGQCAYGIPSVDRRARALATKANWSLSGAASRLGDIGQVLVHPRFRGLPGAVVAHPTRPCS